MVIGAAVETQFVRPPHSVLEALVPAALSNAGERRHPRDGAWVETGSASLVYLCGEVAVRVSRQQSSGADLVRAQGVVDALPDLPFGVPRSRGEAVEVDGLVAIPVERLHGEPHPPGHADPHELRRLLGSIHAVDPLLVRDHLAPARSFTGGERWASVLRDQVVPLLDADVRAEARARVDALEALRPPRRAVTHGDLAGSNVLWSDGRVSGVLDWDLASLEDPAADVASLAVWHGPELLATITDPDTARRADVFRRTFVLQVVAFLVLDDRPDSELAPAIARAERHLRAADAAPTVP